MILIGFILSVVGFKALLPLYRGFMSYRTLKASRELYFYSLDYMLWFYKRETELTELYEQEVCEEIGLGFEEFCQAIYSENIFTYR